MCWIISCDALTAYSAFWLTVITVAILIVGALAANAANATLRLEAEPRIIVRKVSEATIVAAGRLQHAPESVKVPIEIDKLNDERLYVVSAKLAEDGSQILANGLMLSEPDFFAFVNAGNATRPAWPAIRVEIKNLGRSPAIEISMVFRLFAAGTSVGWLRSGAEQSDAPNYSGEDAIVIHGIAPAASEYIWIANTLGIPCSLSVVSPGRQRSPRKPDSGETVSLSFVQLSNLLLVGATSNA